MLRFFKCGIVFDFQNYSIWTLDLRCLSAACGFISIYFNRRYIE